MQAFISFISIPLSTTGRQFLTTSSKTIFAHNIWLSAGRPSSGSVFDLKKNAKYKYKIAVRDAVREFEGRFDDELLSNYMKKDFNSFWKTWKKKAHNKRRTQYLSHAVAGV